MTDAVKNRGAGGQGSILFRQNLEYPRTPGQITYYPPEPSDELKIQVKKDRAGGLALYVIGFAIVLIGYIGAMDFSDTIEAYSILIPLLLVLGLVFAIMYLYMGNLSLAKLARALPLILMVCLLLLYIASLLSAITELSQLGENASENAFSNAIENLFGMLLNPAFFMMSTGLLICREGGTMLWTSTKIKSEYIPGMIILEAPNLNAVAPFVQAVAETPKTDRTENDDKLCRNCNGPLEYIEQYQRYYCYECQEYAPKDA